MSLILKSFFFEQTGCQCPANGRMVLSRTSLDIFLFFIYLTWVKRLEELLSERFVRRKLYFRPLLLGNCSVDFSETWQKTSIQLPLPILFFGSIPTVLIWKKKIRQEKWLPWPLIDGEIIGVTGFWRQLTGRKYSASFCKFVFFGLIRQQRLPPGPLIGRDIFYFYSAKTCRFWWNLTKSKYSTSSTYFFFGFFFGLMRQTRWPTWPLTGPFSIFAIFVPICALTKIVAYWRGHCRLLLYKVQTLEVFNWRNLLGASIQRPLPRLFFFFFSGGYVNKNRRPELWLTESSSTSPLQPQHNFFNETWQEASTHAVFYQVLSQLVGDGRTLSFLSITLSLMLHFQIW